jgi:uncharacterized protein
MPRKFFRKYLPSQESIRRHPHAVHLRMHLHHPNVWHLNRRSVSRGVAVGLFAGMVPGTHIAKFPAAALLAIVLHANLPVAVTTTLYMNPLTVGPFVLLAYGVGTLFSPGDAAALGPVPVVDWLHFAGWLRALFGWVLAAGKPLAIGLAAFAVALPAAGYVFAQLAWRAYVTLAWRRRRAARPA